MTQYQLAKYLPALRYWLALLTILVLAGLILGCNRGSLATRSMQASGQSSAPADNYEEEIFTVVKSPPSFPGGNARLQDYIRKNLRYPEDAIKNKVQGRVFVSFIVRKEGTLQDVTVLKGMGHGTNEEALRLVQAMPNWNPGKQSGRVVNVKYNLVIPFTLADIK